MLLFVRLRSLLFELCPDEPVALCEACRRAYTPEQLGTEIGNDCYLCRQCGADLRESLVAHARTCPNLAPQKPLARMTSVSGSTIPPAAAERFAARRRIRLGQDAHAGARVRSPDSPDAQGRRGHQPTASSLRAASPDRSGTHPATAAELVKGQRRLTN